MLITLRLVPFASTEYQQLLRLRYDVLRKPIGMELREKDTALDHTEYHIAALDGDVIVGCVLLRPLDAQTVKLRQMAVTDTHQGQGIGAQLVQYAEKLAVEKGFTTVETNARRTAQGFYEKLGYQPLGEPFMEVKLHTIKMHKRL